MTLDQIFARENGNSKCVRISTRKKSLIDKFSVVFDY